MTGTWRGNFPGRPGGRHVRSHPERCVDQRDVLRSSIRPWLRPGTIAGSHDDTARDHRRLTAAFTPFTFTGDPGPDVNTIAGVLNQSGFNNDPLTITRQ